MVSSYYNRVITFESVLNFRDLGGYQAGKGRVVAWRRLFRSGNLAEMTENDFSKFHGELGVSVVIDLRSEFRNRETGIGESGQSGYHTPERFLRPGGR